MSTHHLETLVRNPKAIFESYQEAFKNPREFFRNLDVSAEYMDSAMVIALSAAATTFFAAAGKWSFVAVMTLPFSVIAWVIFSFIAAFIGKLVQPLYGAEGTLKEYYAAMAWLALLSLPISLVAYLLSSDMLMALCSIATVIMYGYAFVLRFGASEKLVKIGSGFCICLIAFGALFGSKKPDVNPNALAALEVHQGNYSSRAASARQPQQAGDPCEQRVQQIRGTNMAGGKRSDMIRNYSRYEASLTEWVKRSGGEEAVRMMAQRNPAKSRDYIKVLNDRECTRKILAAIGG